jgi:hypothetical protein
MYDNGVSSVWSWVNTAGSGCSSPSISASEISTKIQAAGTTCTTYPTVTTLCVKADVALTNKLSVLLDSSTTFESTFSRDKDIVVNSINIGSAGSVQSEQGPLDTIDGDTIFEYTLEETVNPGDTSVPASLACYDNCPEITTATTLASCSNSDCSYDSKAVLQNTWVNAEGECSVKPTGITFAGIDGVVYADFTLTYQTSKDSSNNDVFLLQAVDFAGANRGINCDHGTLSFTLTGGTCGTVPVIQGHCAHNADDITASHANLYTFDPSVGYITDVTTSTTQTSAHASDFQWYGVFFEPTTDNLAKLICDYDANLLCPWKAWDELDEYYTYETGGQVGINVLLMDGSTPVPFNRPKSFLYKHTTTSSNSGRDYSGARFFLEYFGSGELRGLPEMCVDAAGDPSDCIPNETNNIPDINIPKNAVLSGVGLDDDFNGYSFVTKPGTTIEYYPTHASSSPCTNAGLTFGVSPAITPPAFASIYVDPPNVGDSLPSASDLTNDYALGGDPLSFGGVPLFEITGDDCTN